MSLRNTRIASLIVLFSMLISPMVVLADHSPEILHGTVFHDANQNGLLDEGEGGIADVTLELDDGVSITTAITDVDGIYAFEGLTAGEYTLTEIDPEGYISTTSNEVLISVDGETILESVDFGDVPVGELGSISGFVYDDLDRDRLFTEADDPLADVVIHLLDDEGMQLALTTTAMDGSYSFEELLPGMYSVVEHDPEGYYSTTPNTLEVTLLAGDGLIDLNFGDFVPEEGETTPIDFLVMDFFDVPLLDILELREYEGMGYGNIAKAYYAAQMSELTIPEILALLEQEGGWGNLWKALFGSAGLKGNNLGRIVSGRDEAQQERLINGCPLVTTPEQAQAILNSGVNQGSVKKLCSMVMEAGGDYETLVEAIGMRAEGMHWKDIMEAITTPEGEAEFSPGPPACKGLEKKNNPDC